MFNINPVKLNHCLIIRVKFKLRFCLFFSFLILFTFSCLWGKPKVETATSYWQQAKKNKLYEHAYWLKLLHFYAPGESIGQWSFHSDVVTPAFFLSPDGQTSPKAEMKATIEAFLSPVGEDANQHAQCKFVARFQWLKQELNFKDIPRSSCPQVERWANLEEATGISLVFVSAYFENPASAFGHLLLKFNTKNRYFAHSLLSPTLNFGAMVGADDNPLEYVFRGLVGGYVGSFSDERFYNYNDFYGEKELRDLWEYPVLFSKEERNRVTYHTWELMQNVGFDYYFFLDNCAYRMAELLELAWTDTTRINTQWAFWAIPVDVVFKSSERKVADSGSGNQQELTSLLGTPKLISSRQRKLQLRVSNMNSDELLALQNLVKKNDYFKSDEFHKLPEKLQAKTLDALLDYQRYTQTKNRKKSNLANRIELLKIRSELPVLEKVTPNFAVQAPTTGTPPMRFRFSSVHNSVTGNAMELGAWANYHDLMGDETGHLENAELVTLDLNVQIQDKDWAITQFQLFRIQKLAINPTGIPGNFEWSWRTQGGWQRENLACFTCRKFSLSGGFGRAFRLAETDVEYLFLDIFAESSRSNWSEITWGLAPTIGLTWEPTENWKTRLDFTHQQSFSDPEKLYQKARWQQRWALSQNWDVRLEMEQWEAFESKLALHYFW